MRSFKKHFTRKTEVFDHSSPQFTPSQFFVQHPPPCHSLKSDKMEMTTKFFMVYFAA